jgi:DNA replication protein DnaC
MTRNWAVHCGNLHEASKGILPGPTGVGKTHPAFGLAEEAIRASHPAWFKTAHEMGANRGKACHEGRLDRQLRVCLGPKARIIDEMGCLPREEPGATIFFQLVSARYQRGSFILTSNKGGGDWGSVFGDPILATAILDRLLQHSTPINVRGESDRLRERGRAGLLPRPGNPQPPPVEPAAAPPAAPGGCGKRSHSV